MDILLSKVTQGAVNYAIRSGITITSGFAIQQCSRLLRNVKGDDRRKISTLQRRLESKISIISPAIDMIELIAARGNTSLESAVSLTKELRLEIQNLGVRLSKAAADEELSRKGSSRAKSREQNDLELDIIVGDMERLLARIEDAVPLINLAITTSGVSLSTTLPPSVSPSRLLQASTFLTSGDANYAARPGTPVEVGPVFVLSVYMLFTAHALRPHDSEGVRETTWQEVIHKARVKLMRVPLDRIYDLPGSMSETFGQSVNGALPRDDGYFPTDVPSQGKAYEFGYQLLIVEDFDDDRMHDEHEQEPFQDVARAGIREVIPVHQVSKLFYADTGKILNIGNEGEATNPILLVKRDVNAEPPRRMMQRQDTEPNEKVSLSTEVDEERAASEDADEIEDEDGPDAQLRRESSAAFEPQSPETLAPDSPKHKKWSFPPNLDPEWMALEVYHEAPDTDDEEYDTSAVDDSSPAAKPSFSPLDPLTAAFNSLRFRSPTPTPSPGAENFRGSQLVHKPALQPPENILPVNTPSLPNLRSSLSLLELLIRLTALQQFQQSSHLAITDELLNFFLHDSSTTGAGADTEYRKKVRRDARRRVGFDPYDESPIKRRGEEYIDHYGEHDQAGWNESHDYDDGPTGDWRESPRSAYSRTASNRNSPGLTSPPPNSSPSFRKSVPPLNSGSPMRQPTFGRSTAPQTPPKGRPDVLRRATMHGRSPLGRNESDSTFGTSPNTTGLNGAGQQDVAQQY
ncbi:Ran-binding-domain-containing protein [Venturia nashicola]|uniref:Ran-binding-domain-containing protein n=1 Tax=Venturia nashicola TaxID=86259 RepID=A0A4Z1NZ38_9PEZI|nr:Ran-binding-domain-containing protein [Venturia nashicola]